MIINADAVDRRKGEVLDERRDLLHRRNLNGDSCLVRQANTSLTGGSSPGTSASAITPM